MYRRTALSAAGSALAVGLAGCQANNTTTKLVSVQNVKGLDESTYITNLRGGSRGQYRPNLSISYETTEPLDLLVTYASEPLSSVGTDTGSGTVTAPLPISPDNEHEYTGWFNLRVEPQTASEDSETIYFSLEMRITVP